MLTYSFVLVFIFMPLVGIKSAVRNIKKISSKYKSKRHKIHIIICCIISYLEKKMRIALLMI